jgi:hypothetical protein
MARNRTRSLTLRLLPVGYLSQSFVKPAVALADRSQFLQKRG